MKPRPRRRLAAETPAQTQAARRRWTEGEIQQIVARVQWNLRGLRIDKQQLEREVRADLANEVY